MTEIAHPGGIRARRTTEGLIFLALFTACIPAANWLIQHVGTKCIPDGPCLIPVLPDLGSGSLMAPSAVLVVGLAFVLRDLVQRRLGVGYAALAVVFGAGLSSLLAPPSLVIASGVAYRVLINNDLLKVPEIRPFSLPIDFALTRKAQETNLETRREALRLLSEGTTIVVFPGGGVSTSPTTFGRAIDLPWKTFTARMVQSSKAQVLPLYFEGQCSPLFQWVSKWSPTLRLSLIIREFRSRVGQPLKVHVGDVISAAECSQYKDRKALINMLCERVHALGGINPETLHAEMAKLPAWLRI